MWADVPIDWDNEQGMVAIGGDLRPERLLSAYRQGLFPWFSEGMPICWWCPDPRAIFDLDGLNISRRLDRTYRSGKFRFTFDRAFRDVMKACARERAGGTWITRGMLDGYSQMHQLGHAHSIEVWLGDDLVGGLYGIALGGLFAGESMFSRVSDASKVAMIRLFAHLRLRGYTLFDTQFLTPHTRRMGAMEIPRDEYLRRLRAALAMKVTFSDSVGEMQ